MRSALHPDYGYLHRLSSKSLQITDITSDNGTVKLSQRHDQRIKRRSFLGFMTELGSPTSEGHRHRVFDQARTDELVQRRVTTGPSL